MIHDAEKEKRHFDRILSPLRLRVAINMMTTSSMSSGKSLQELDESPRQRTTATTAEQNVSLLKMVGTENPDHCRAFFKRLHTEKPDCCLVMPPCKLWSLLQELTIAQHPDYAEKLEALRQENHDGLLVFAAMVYEYQRRNGKLGIAEHPWKSRAWFTKAFKRMQGYDTRVDQCCYGLEMPDDNGGINPVQKPTCFRATGKVFHDKLARRCDGQHQHTRLEGSIPGVGRRSMLAENYPQRLATAIVNAICAQLDHDTAGDLCK